MFKKFILIAVPINFAWIIISSIYNINIASINVNHAAREEIAGDRATSYIIDTYLHEFIEGLFVVRDANEMWHYRNSVTDRNFIELQGLFIRIMSNKKGYKKLLLLDSDGKSVINITNGVNTPYISDSFYNYSNKDYFLNGRDLENGLFYISDEDIDKALPVITISTPIYNDLEKLVGVLVLEVNAEKFLKLFKNSSNISNVYNGKSYVFDGSGKIIKADEDIKTITNKYPDLLKHINGYDSDYKGFFRDNGNLYIYYDLLNYTRESIPNFNQKWILMNVIDSNMEIEIDGLVQNLFTPINILIIVLTNALILIVVIYQQRLRITGMELKVAHEISYSTTDAIIITDRNNIITHVNRAYEKATGYNKLDVIGTTPGDYKSGQHSSQFYDNMWQSINSKGVWEGSLWDKTKDGILYPKKLKIIAIRDKKNGPISNYVGVFSPLTLSIESNNNVISLRDNSLTQENMLVSLMSSNIHQPDERFVILSIHIVNFNQLLSTNPNIEAAQISGLFSELVKPLIKTTDIIAQTGRAMFNVVVYLEKDIDYFAYIRDFNKNIGRIVTKDSNELLFKTHMGISFWPNDGKSIKELLLNAVIAQDWAKNNNTDYEFYTPEMAESIRYDNILERHLKKAIELNEFFVVYQPQVDQLTGRTIGAEALIRWNNCDLGFVSPDNFIPIAERTEHIVEIGYWVIHQVCKDLVILTRSTNLDPNFKVAINISPKQLEDSSFDIKVINIIDSYNLDHKLFEFEITETLLMSNHKLNSEILEFFKQSQISIALDDFGTGYSSLSYLHNLPINKMKIDRSFIKDYPEHDDGKMVYILTEMAKILKLNILCEGVETKEQLEFLKKVGCNIIQGYYYSKPIDFSEFIKFIK